jgi:hypothetical protein
MGRKKFPEWWYYTLMVGHTTITFKDTPLRHTHTPSILALLKAPAEGFFWDFSQFSSRIWFGVPHGCETCHPETHFQSLELPKVTRSEIRWLLGCEVTAVLFRRGNVAQQATCVSVHHRDAETTIPANCRGAPTEMHRIAKAKLTHRNGQQHSV